MSVFFYSNKKTFMHRLNPAVKITLLLMLFLVSALCTDIYKMLFILAVITVLFLSAKSMESIKKTGMLFILIGLTTFILWTVFYKGRGDKIIFFYKNSMLYAAAMSLRFVNMLLSGLLFLSITSLEEFSDGLIMLKVPYGAAFAVSLSFRLVIIFISTGFTIAEAQKVRGNDLEKGGILRRIKSYAPLMTPLILNGIKKAQNMTAALESKGFSPGNRINIRDKYKMAGKDIFLMCLMAAVFLAAIYLKFISKTI